MKRSVLFLTVTAALTFPAAALARGNSVVVNESIDGVKLGMTETQVESVVGKPPEVVAANKSYTSFNYGDAGQFEVDFDKVNGKKVVTNLTIAPGYGTPATSKRIGFNSTKAAVMRAYPQAKFNNAIGQIWIDQGGTYATCFLLSRSNRVIQMSVEWNYG